MSQLFDKIKVANTKRSTFDLSHHQVTSSDFGYIIPICYRDMVPNDDFVVKPNVFCRLAPLAVPTYGKITCRIHHFFVPNRVLYRRWDAFITQDKNNFTVPPFYTASFLQQALNTDPSVSSGSGVISANRGLYSRIMSNLGLNPFSVKSLPGTKRISAFPFLAYYRIWLDWFADSNIYDHPLLVESFEGMTEFGGNLGLQTGNPASFLETKFACFKKDYYTTAKLNPQDGNSPSIVGVDIASGINPGLAPTGSADTLGMAPNGSIRLTQRTGESGINSKIGQFTIEALRAANSLQRYLERNNYVGTKLINRILAHFGVSPQPERLDMAEYIGGSSFPIQVADVTSHTPSFNDSQTHAYTTGLGTQAGKGVGAGSGDAVRYHAKEHGIFMSVMSILPDTGYYQGIPRFWTKGVDGDALDYFTPEFENLGYQELLNSEVYVPDPQDTQYQSYSPDGIFGYTPRYSEYKFQNDVLAGDILTNGFSKHTTGAQNNQWHLFRTLSYTDSSPLALNENFVELRNRNNDYDRIFQYQGPDYDHFYFNIYMDVKATRPMSGFGEPSLDATNEGDGNLMDLPYGGTRL